ncbi:hypothetical protein K435DRAFT_892266, partial [Dendrothele bispora CBS 962.96]
KLIVEAGALKALHNSEARFPPPKCHPGTRESILNHLFDWIRANDVENTLYSPIQWLYGPAGVGKSAIAQTLCERFDKEHLIGSFFFSRTSQARNNPRFLFLTIGYCLAIFSNDRDLWTAIDEAVSKNPTILHASIDVQFRELVVGPLRSLPLCKWWPLPKIVIIDGLDECIDRNSQKLVLETIHNGLVGPVTEGLAYRIPLRFLISSRPEHVIRLVFSQPQFYELLDRTVLSDSFETSKDIAVYLRDNFLEIARYHSIEMPWPSHGIIQELVQRASGQFIYASTIIKYIGDVGDYPPTRLDIVLKTPLSDGEAFADLDILYQQILASNPHRKQ